MFTGIIERTGKVQELVERNKVYKFKISIPNLCNVKLGASIAINGVCLTVSKKTWQGFVFDVVPETLSRTNLGELKKGDSVNIELPLKASDFLGGHFVQGHVDGVGAITAKKQMGDSWVYWIKAKDEILEFMVSKGSVALDGVSMTLVDVKEDSFSVAVIPTTLAKTTLGVKGVGGKVNIEIDIFGKYIKKFVSENKQASSTITKEFLQKTGFI